MTERPVDGAAFLGKLTAGATHEIRNVLSVIKESTGLMEDLLDIGGKGEFAHEEKFRRMIRNILAQVERGSAVAKALNTLAHAPDDRRCSVDLHRVLHCQVVLYDRFCRGKEVALTVEEPLSKAFVTTDPVLLHAAVGSVIDALVAESQPGDAITLALRLDAGPVGIVFTVRSSDGAPRALRTAGDCVGAWETARASAAAVGGSLDCEGGSALLVVGGGNATK